MYLLPPGLQGLLYAQFVSKKYTKNVDNKWEMKVPVDEQFRSESVPEFFEKCEKGEYGTNELMHQPTNLELLSTVANQIDKTAVQKMNLMERTSFTAALRKLEEVSAETFLEIRNFEIIVEGRSIKIRIEQENLHIFDRTYAGITLKDIIIDFYNIFGERNLKIEAFKITGTGDKKSVEKNLLDLLTQVMESREEKLPVKHFTAVKMSARIWDILLHFDEDVILSCSMSTYGNLPESARSLESGFWIAMAHFSHEGLILLKNDKFLDDICKAEGVYITPINKLSHDLILVLKEKLLKNPELKEMIINGKLIDGDVVESKNVYKSSYGTQMELNIRQGLITFKSGHLVEEKERKKEEEEKENEVEDKGISKITGPPPTKKPRMIRFKF